MITVFFLCDRVVNLGTFVQNLRIENHIRLDKISDADFPRTNKIPNTI
ncbi:hypothetical protein LEP1GSC103_0552 [Leptospira borgpetersenii serovar Javanica str. UI 09931]|uniref:Uncharacterized protein n=1 Tax=Leptospira borgpetersenii serovar Javanica str. UI 09931 TaxID=1049767 RepID=A0AAV3J969_LEPBO|nr:hypothetical protein LEP1GSC101_0552 [Leptospira borgpetersenii str. UI 09149]EMN59747.1 hypothetical protein LEP1GSC090_2830 [Leptospira borgpetersenii serovar Javanica str. MK146]EPG56184.1 hypothetical protein LEP1GSC103_0552 [Leptospira borgpetersenii serovar Javanica str. UI 09931]